MNTNQSQKLQTQALWQELNDDVAAQLAGGGRVKGKGWGKCQVPGKCEVGISIVVKF
ncbi:hypothetical protein I8751_20980 [Nostocaceae cyanobacterium CENA357]|uniref:Uncharacterized protein n=1 Tax=Atlanticothrix silvestris CENA357 TaxID=1725252 RepID=A0A8J7HFM1_9CYAN|nr:hypothetical protein [Atlanticothrix silvestris]MBH8554783.1 hypothetical protein [Atlanticothrix silvestris CENA357]